MPPLPLSKKLSLLSDCSLQLLSIVGRLEHRYIWSSVTRSKDKSSHQQASKPFSESLSQALHPLGTLASALWKTLTNRMNLSVDPRAVALYNNSPKTQLSKYALATTPTDASKDQKAPKKGLMRRALRRRKRGRVQTQKKPSQSVKPKATWQTQSLSVLIAGLREKREAKEGAALCEAENNVVQSVSSWDDFGNSIGSIINESSSISSEEQELRAAPISLLDADDWDAQILESDVVDEDDCKSCHSDASSVVVWDSIRIERQKAVPVVDRDLKSSGSSALVTVPDPSAELCQAELLSNAISKWENLPKRDDKSRKGAKGSLGGKRRLGNIVSSSGNKKGEEFAVNLMVNDTFLVYQAKTRATKI